MKELSALRAEIDRIDTQIAALFAERMACAEAVAETKRNSPEPTVIRQPKREAEILEKRAAQVTEHGERAKVLFAALMDLSCALQYETLGECPEALRGATEVQSELPDGDALRRILTLSAGLGVPFAAVTAVPSADDPRRYTLRLRLQTPQTEAEAAAADILLGALNAEYGCVRFG